MKRRILAAIFVSCLALGSSSCSGDRASFEAPSDGGTDSGGKAGAAQAGSAGKAGASTNGAGSPSGGTSTGGTSNADQPNCDTDFDALDRSCTSAEDCVLAQHQIDCCGTILTMGLRASEQAAFDAIEQYCSSQFPACGCAARGIQLEDGSLIDFGSSAVRVECIEQRCRSRNANPTMSCGDKACTKDQYCSQFVGGPAGSEPSYSCMPLGDCQDCECLNVVGCECTGEGSAIKVFCAAP